MKTKTSGSGLIFAVVLLFVILGMAITLSSITVLETKMSQKTKSSIGAFYNAEAGVEWVLNQISIKNSTDPISSIGSCPFGCNVQFLGADGKVLASSETIDKVKAVRSVGTQGDETQRAIEAAVAASGSISYPAYCCNAASNCTPECPSSDPTGTQSICALGFKIVQDLGVWQWAKSSSTCGTTWDDTVTLPYGISANGASYNCGFGEVGHAYLCSK